MTLEKYFCGKHVESGIRVGHLGKQYDQAVWKNEKHIDLLGQDWEFGISAVILNNLNPKK